MAAPQMVDIFRAAFEGRTGTVRLLLDNGADVDVRNERGETPLWIAGEGDHAETVRLLLGRNANPISQTSNKCLPSGLLPVRGLQR